MKNLAALVCGLVLGLTPSELFSQSKQVLRFDVTSVKANKSETPPSSNFPLNSGDAYVKNGGLLSATNLPLITYIFFAYKLQGNQGQGLAMQLPGWAMTDRFDIQARVNGDPTKDEMRLMMQSLLAERFKFAVHTEKRDVPVLAFVLEKPGKTGPQLQQHAAEPPCQTTFAPPTADKPDALKTMLDGLPAICNTILGVPPKVAGRSRLAGRNVTIGYMADMFSQRVNRDRPMLDATGLTGTFDFTLEFVPDPLPATAPGTNPSLDEGPTFDQALRDQLGLKTESRKSSMDLIILDHVEHPTEN